MVDHMVMNNMENVCKSNADIEQEFAILKYNGMRVLNELARLTAEK